MYQKKKKSAEQYERKFMHEFICAKVTENEYSRDEGVVFLFIVEFVKFSVVIFFLF